MFTYLGYECWSSRVLWLWRFLVRIHKPILALVLQKFGAEAKLDHMKTVDGGQREIL